MNFEQIESAALAQVQSLAADLHRFFALGMPDTKRSEAIARFRQGKSNADDHAVIRGRLASYVINGTANQRRHAQSLLERFARLVL